MKRACHTSTTPGKRVLIVTRDRLRLEGRFIEERSRYIAISALNSGIRVEVEKGKIDKFIVKPDEVRALFLRAETCKDYERPT